MNMNLKVKHLKAQGGSMQGSLRQWFFHEDSWAITLGLGMVVAFSGLFAWDPAGLVGQVHL